MGLQVSGRAIGSEFADAGTQIYQHAESGTAGDGVDHAGGVGVVITQDLNHPPIGVPAPGGIDHPGNRANHDGNDPERERTHALDHRAGND